MVNADRVKRKLPSLLCDGETGTRANDNRYMRYRYLLIQFKKRRPERFNSLLNRLVAVLEAFDREIRDF
jgi:hypothetical protein